MSGPDGEHPPGLFAYMALLVDYYIFPGKFCFINHPSHQIWREHWSDAADVGGERQCTMNAFNTAPEEWDKARHIDYIYYRNIAAPVRFSVNQTLYDGRCASDHFVVWADFNL